MAGFAPRKQNLVLYHHARFRPVTVHYSTNSASTGPARSCLYVNKLDDIDLQVLEELVRASVAEMGRRYE